VEPISTQPVDNNLPQTEAEVPRVSLEEAEAALDSGAAIFVDVRSPAAYETSHTAGAISIPLGEIERNLTGLALEKDQWIITYCT
jgi:rhodanese-related sulfurtransferase